MSGGAEVLDSHIHFWDPHIMDYPWLTGNPRLNRAFGAADLDPGARAAAGFVFVQADCAPGQSLAEVRWVTTIAATGTPIRGVVAHAPLENGRRCRDDLDRMAQESLVVGIRRLIQDEPAGFALAPDFVDGVRLLADHGLVFDLCVRDHQLAEVAELVRRCPEVRFVLDHLGKPQVAAGNCDPWRRDLAVLAGLPSVSCKLSGLAVEADPDRPIGAQVRPYLEHALEVFGPRRCLFGSDWPVSSMAVGYADWLAIVEDATAHLDGRARQDVFAGNATSLYGLADAHEHDSGSSVENPPWH